MATSKTPKRKAKKAAKKKPVKRTAKRKSVKPTPRGKPKLAAAQNFRNRIVGYEQVDPATIKRNPLNWRSHPESQKSVMTDALSRLGYVDTCVVNKRTRNLIDGELRLDIAEENAEATVPVLWVDLSPAEERLALASINPMSELAGTDPEQLAKLLGGLEPGGGPLDELLRSLEQMAASTTVKSSKSSSRNTGSASPGHTLRLVLAVPDVVAIERAVLMTGIANRGEAFKEICRHYLESFDDDGQEGQHDADEESQSADQLAQALAGAALDP